MTALLFLCMFSVNAFAQGELKIAYVNMEKAIKSSALSKQLAGEFEKTFTKRAKEVQSLEKALIDMRQQAIKDRLSMSAQKIEELQGTLIKKDRELRFKKTILEEDAKLGQDRINRQVQSAVAKVLRELTKQEKYDLVLISGVLYSSERVDITDKVIAKLQ